MKAVIDGVEVQYPQKLEWRLDEILQLVREELKSGKNFKRCKVWETKRHDLVFHRIKEEDESGKI